MGHPGLLVQDYVAGIPIRYIPNNFDLGTQCFTLFYQDCVGACHLKNYCFVITYLLKDEQELSLGMLDTSQMYL
jgi:hypothetical protein